MHLPKTEAIAARVIWLDEVESTNSALRSIAQGTDDLPHPTLLISDNQIAGRGRQGREWITEPHLALAISVLLQPVPQTAPLGATWMPLFAGSAMVAALQPFFARTAQGDETSRVGVKWPNDVHVRTEQEAAAGSQGKKLSGILAEVLPDGRIIIGVGVNVLLEDWQLPTDRATSLLAAGAHVGNAQTLRDTKGRELADGIVASFLRELTELIDLAQSEPQAARNRVLRDSFTLGTEVRVHLPGDAGVVDGRAVALGDDGSLIVDRPTTGQLIVTAADVEHLR